MTEQILKIGQDILTAMRGPEAGCEERDQVLLMSPENDHMLPSISDANKRDKGIEDYPQPLAVVGVSVL